MFHTDVKGIHSLDYCQSDDENRRIPIGCIYLAPYYLASKWSFTEKQVPGFILSILQVSNSKQAEKQPYNLLPFSVLGYSTSTRYTKFTPKEMPYVADGISSYLLLSGYTVMTCEGGVTGWNGAPDLTNYLIRLGCGSFEILILPLFKGNKPCKIFLPTIHLQHCSFHQ